VITTERDDQRGVLRRIVKGIQDDDVFGLAAELAYRFLFAVFPFGLFVAALGAFIAGLLHVDNPADQIVNGLGDNLPPSIAGALRPELQRLLSSPRADLLSLGAIAALWAATGGTNALVKGMHRAYGVPESRPFLLRYAVAIGLTVLGAVGVVAAFVTIIGGAVATQELAGRLGLGSQAYSVVELMRWPAVFVALTIAVAILYRYAPNVVVPWRWIVLGAALFTIGWLAATAALGYYAANFANYGATYGSLGGVIVLMLWLYVTGALLLIGAEVTAALAQVRTPGEIRRRREEEDVGSAIDGASAEARRRAGSAAGSAVETARGSAAEPGQRR
jgi:membrane protein